MSSGQVLFEDGGKRVRVRLHLDAEHVEALGLMLSPGRTTASFDCELSQPRLARRYQQALDNPHRFTCFENGAIYVRAVVDPLDRDEQPPTAPERTGGLRASDP